MGGRQDMTNTKFYKIQLTLWSISCHTTIFNEFLFVKSECDNAEIRKAPRPYDEKDAYQVS